MLIPHRLLDAIGTEALDRPAHEEPRLVERIAKRIPRIAEHNEIAGLGHECAHMANRAPHHDFDALHRDAATRRGIAVDAEQSAAPCGACRLARIPRDMHKAAHHVLGDAGACAAMNQYGRKLVHASAVIADRPVDLDRDWYIETGGNPVPAGGMINDPMPLIGIRPELMQRRVECAERGAARTALGHCLAFPEIARGGLRVPYASRLDAGKAGKSAKFRAEGDIAVGL